MILCKIVGKTCERPIYIFQMPFGILEIFSIFFKKYFNIILFYYEIYIGLDPAQSSGLG
jgi:hypothetical protein